MTSVSNACRFETEVEEGETTCHWRGRIVLVDPNDDAQARLTAEERRRPASRGRSDLLIELRRRLAGVTADSDGKADMAVRELRDGERY